MEMTHFRRDAVIWKALPNYVISEILERFEKRMTPSSISRPENHDVVVKILFKTHI